jgi:NAD(P)-dependent dehydrogenase (short-subunit alcohol dehydrogenase family)
MHLSSSVAAVVTGGASGLGAATVRALAATGVRVTLFDTDAVRGAALASEIGALFAAVDVTAQSSVERGFALARAAHGQERILVNCAGILAAGKTVTRQRDTGAISAFPIELFERVVNVNLIGTFRCLAHAAAGMLTNTPDAGGERGVIVNTASVAAAEGQIGQAAYAASKGGVVALSVPVARDLASEGVRVNAILPGVFATPMLAGASDELRSALASAVPFPQRLGQPQEFAALVLEICRNAYLNGAAIRLDGALRMPPR